jgi:hypothetical protein
VRAVRSCRGCQSCLPNAVVSAGLHAVNPREAREEFELAASLTKNARERTLLLQRRVLCRCFGSHEVDLTSLFVIRGDRDSIELNRHYSLLAKKARTLCQESAEDAASYELPVLLKNE